MPFAVDGKCAGAVDEEALERRLHEDVPGGHDVEEAAGWDELGEDEGVGVAAVVGGQEDAVAGAEGSLQVFRAADVDVVDAEALGAVAADVEARGGAARDAAMGGMKLVGFVDDDLLHGGMIPRRPHEAFRVPLFQRVPSARERQTGLVRDGAIIGTSSDVCRRVHLVS